MEKISVAIVEDNKAIRLALEQILNMSDGYKLCCSCINGEEALSVIPLLQPQVVLMDINLGGIDGIECVRIIKEKNPDILFMMCTVLEEDDKIFKALIAGANGYILKKTAPSKMLDSIKELYEGGAPMSSQIARKLVAVFQQKAVPDISINYKALESLTKREKEVLEMLSGGLLYKEIAEKTGISAETVKKHLYKIYDKLHVSNRVEAVNKYFGR